MWENVKQQRERERERVKVNLHIEFEAADNLTKFGNSYNYMNNAAALNKCAGLLCLFNGLL